MRDRVIESVVRRAPKNARLASEGRMHEVRGGEGAIGATRRGAWPAMPIERTGEGPCVAVLGAWGEVALVSAGLPTLLGREAREMVGRVASEWVHPLDAARIEALFARVATDREREAHAVLRVRSADGAWRWVEARMRSLTRDWGHAGVLVELRLATAPP